MLDRIMFVATFFPLILGSYMIGILMGEKLIDITIPLSYIEYVGGDIDFKLQTYKALDEMNAISEHGVVKYSGFRPIVVYEKEKGSMPPQRLGQAVNQVFYCIIQVKQGLPAKQLRRVLQHEYLHCLGYEHVDNPEDIMYYSDDPRMKTSSIDKYINELDKKMN